MLQLKGHTLIDICTHPFNLEATGNMVPVGPRSLTVMALSTGEGCFASSCLKFQSTGLQVAPEKEPGDFPIRNLKTWNLLPATGRHG